MGLSGFMEIILASASPRREMLLRKILDDFKIIPSQTAEEMIGQPPENAAMHNALQKALNVSANHPEAMVIGVDTLVVLGDAIMGKPADPEDAIKMLESLSGQTHEVITGIAMVCASEDEHITDFESSAVTFSGNRSRTPWSLGK